MSSSILAMIALAMLVSAALWFSLWLAGSAELAVLPASCRRRVHWWQAHAVHCYLSCAVLAAAMLGLQLQQLVF